MTVLEKINLFSVDLVDEGDDENAHIVFFKRRAAAGEDVVEIRGEVAKVDDEERRVFGWAYVAAGPDGNVSLDKSGQSIPIEELEKAAYEFMQGWGSGGEMHMRSGIAGVVESWVSTPEKLSKMGLSGVPYGWWIGLEVNDPAAWQKVKSGQYKMFSIAGVGKAAAPASMRKEQGMTERQLASETNSQTVDRERREFVGDGREIVTRESVEVHSSLDVVEIATEEAETLMRREPGKYPNIAAARNQVWETRPDLQKAYRDLPAESARHRNDVPADTPVLKGQGVIDKATAAAQQLVAAGTFKSLASARSHVWETRPDLADEYQKARAS